MSIGFVVIVLFSSQILVICISCLFWLIALESCWSLQRRHSLKDSSRYRAEAGTRMTSKHVYYICVIVWRWKARRNGPLGSKGAFLGGEIMTSNEVIWVKVRRVVTFGGAAWLVNGKGHLCRGPPGPGHVLFLEVFTRYSLRWIIALYVCVCVLLRCYILQ